MTAGSYETKTVWTTTIN